jgi:hypothetical protein
VRYEPYHFFTYSWDLGTEKEEETLSKWPKILTPVVKEN